MGTEQNPNPGTPKIIPLLLVLMLTIGVFFFLTLTLPQILGFTLDKIYFSAVSLAGSFLFLPFIKYIKRSSGLPADISFKFPGTRIMLLLAVLAITLKIIANPFFHSQIHFEALNDGKLMLNSFGLKDHDPGTLMNFISMALLAPFFEEIFWRGQIQDLMLRRFSPAKAIILTSILFTIFHLKFDNTIALFICGLIFGIVYHQTHSLGAVIFLHSFLNLLEFGSKYISVNATDEIFLINYLLFILSVIVVIVITRYLGETVKLQRP